jgi:hypothetical protein
MNGRISFAIKVEVESRVSILFWSALISKLGYFDWTKVEMIRSKEFIGPVIDRIVS